jgi:hypothetical protein
MLTLSESEDLRVDLDRIDMLRAAGKSERYVVPGAGPDDQDTVQ